MNFVPGFPRGTRSFPHFFGFLRVLPAQINKANGLRVEVFHPFAGEKAKDAALRLLALPERSILTNLRFLLVAPGPGTALTASSE
jgi:hypothetical protein